MSLFDYSTPNVYEVLIWSLDEHGFVQLEVANLET